MEISELSQYIAGAVLLLGAVFSVLAAAGVLRFPDLYTRLHAATKAGTVGAGMVLLAIAVSAFDMAVTLRALAGIVFLVLTSPIAAHLLARAAYKVGIRPSPLTTTNEREEENA